jgi:hypothetical protein
MNEILLILYCALQIADGVTTYIILKDGKEQNPILKRLFEATGVLGGLILSKGLGIGLGLVAYEFTGFLAPYILALMVVGYAWVVIHNIRQL